MKIFRNFDVSASALTAERLRMDIISSNVANADTTRTQGGGPVSYTHLDVYKRQGR